MINEGKLINVHRKIYNRPPNKQLSGVKIPAEQAIKKVAHRTTLGSNKNIVNYRIAVMMIAQVNTCKLGKASCKLVYKQSLPGGVFIPAYAKQTNKKTQELGSCVNGNILHLLIK
jgi:hypothetical protein